MENGVWILDEMYSRLNKEQIWILDVHPGKPEDILTASLGTVNLLQAPSFEALLYV
jgi:hypothetical protein